MYVLSSVMRSRIVGYVLEQLHVSYGHREEFQPFAERAADMVEKVMNDLTEEEIARISTRNALFIQKDVARAYVGEFRALVEKDIEAAAQRHLLATLGPRVEALEKAVERDDPMARLKKFLDTLRKEVRDDQKPFEMGKLRTIEYIEGWMRGEKQP